MLLSHTIVIRGADGVWQVHPGCHGAGAQAPPDVAAEFDRLTAYAALCASHRWPDFDGSRHPVRLEIGPVSPNPNPWAEPDWFDGVRVSFGSLRASWRTGRHEYTGADEWEALRSAVSQAGEFGPAWGLGGSLVDMIRAGEGAAPLPGLPV